ncbi:hypothetical protein F0562_023502 [Nyssa sinensis]|uniref:Glucose/Sorbosone dehydrogenase domain-containing protein n=1 Tax=Nyssa sinensis TaxID=561372 RepID=A0A5J5BKY0_9ASTE|nr:hypothetical protein F0562_023502 [Nyssa sinensis]
MFQVPYEIPFFSEKLQPPPQHFLCTFQDQYEEIDIVTKGGNYGWRVYEGPYLFHPTISPGGNTSASSINPIFPVMGYNHSQLDKHIGSASIAGGYFYHSMTDPCMYGRYLYTDLYAAAMFVGNEIPKNRGNFTTSKISFSCADYSPIHCSTMGGSPRTSIGYAFSLAEDNKKDVYILTSTGVYRVAHPSRCNYQCSKKVLLLKDHLLLLQCLRNHAMELFSALINKRLLSNDKLWYCCFSGILGLSPLFTLLVIHLKRTKSSALSLKPPCWCFVSQIRDSTLQGSDLCMDTQQHMIDNEPKCGHLTQANKPSKFNEGDERIKFGPKD